MSFLSFQKTKRLEFWPNLTFARSWLKLQGKLGYVTPFLT